MRLALHLYFCEYPKTQQTYIDENELTVVNIIDYHIKDYTVTAMNNKSESEASHETQNVELEQNDSTLTSVIPKETHVFSCGHPDAQTIHGIMYTFNDTSKCGDDYKSDFLCMMAVPTVFTLPDLLEFLVPYIHNINGVRIINDNNPDSFMVLIRFINEEKAEEFYSEHHDKPFNSIEVDTICHLAFVHSIEFGKTEVHMKSLAAGPLIELPQCAVCLERLDEGTTGMLTVLCNHTFHCECMTKCTTCPVCRFHALPPEQSSQLCMVCGNTEGLWLCLICGYLGCGRYKDGHARGHFERTNHTYSMDVEERSVWDYVGDNYVHRLIQNKADGKLVAIQDQEGVLEEKFESLTLEYSYLLTQQLESQRDFWEKKLLFVEQEAMERIIIVEEEIQKVTQEKDKYKKLFEEGEEEKKKLLKKSGEERKRLEKKVDLLTNKFNVLSKELTKELTDERELNKSLQANQKELIATQKLHFSETHDLKEQLKDLMFHLQGEATINNSPMKEDIRGGDMHVVQGPSNDTRSKRSPRKKR